MAGSMDRCEISVTNSPGPGVGTASLVNSQSEARGSPDGRSARRTWRLVCGIKTNYAERTTIPPQATCNASRGQTRCPKPASLTPLARIASRYEHLPDPEQPGGRIAAGRRADPGGSGADVGVDDRPALRARAPGRLATGAGGVRRCHPAARGVLRGRA